MEKTNVKETNRVMNSGDTLSATTPFSVNMEDDEVSQKIKKLEQNMETLERLEETESKIDNQFSDDQDDLNVIEEDTNIDNARELNDDMNDSKRISDAGDQSVIFENKAEELEQKDPKDELDFAIEQKLKRLADLKKKKQLLELEREITETEKQTETVGFIGSIFRKKSEEELLRETSLLDRELKLSELQTKINKKKQLLKNTGRTDTARKILSGLKEELFDAPQKKAAKKTKKKTSSMDGLGKILFG